MRDPKDRSRRLTDGTRWRTFIRFLRWDDLMTSYTNELPGAGLVLDLDLATASGLLASRCRTSPMYRACYKVMPYLVASCCGASTEQHEDELARHGFRKN